MSIVIIGSGLMGTAFKRRLPKAHLLGRDVLDISLPDTFDRVFDVLSPSLIINCAAYTKVDQAESEPDLANHINGTAVGHLATYAAKHALPLVHFSTDYVFNGSKQTPYTEEDAPSPCNAYGHSKWLGENALQRYCSHFFLFRIQWIYGKNGNNFVEAIRKKALATGHVDVVNDQWGSPTWSEDLAEKIIEFLQLVPSDMQLSPPRPPFGLYHVAATGYTTWYDFAQEILTQTHSQATLSAISSSAMVRPAKRPLNGKLDCAKFAKHTALPRSWQEGLRGYLTT